uniref:Uncharacterized protein n=1 Tax=Anguilla anguilla TaxID=7936 RepID=A0A0E9WVK4_ANGAN
MSIRKDKIIQHVTEAKGWGSHKACLTHGNNRVYGKDRGQRSFSQKPEG